MAIMRNHFLAVLGGVLLAASLAAPATAQTAFPTTYLVSTTPGDTPEGIAVTADGTMYVTSVGTGAVYRGNVHDRQLHPFIPAGADGRGKATGVHVDAWGRIFVAGYDTGTLYAYDRAGHLLAARPTIPGAALNDLTFGPDAVYVTDSVNQIIWRAQLSAATVGPLRPWLTRDRFSPTPFFLNGIVITPDQRVLLVAEQGQNVTYRVDIAAQQVQVIAVSGADGMFSADGLLLEGHRLYGVYNSPDPSLPSGFAYVTRLVAMNRDYTAATWIADSGKAADPDTPTTIARDAGRLLWVNSQLGVAPGTPPYTVSQVPDLS